MHLKNITRALRHFRIRDCCLKNGQRYCHSQVLEKKLIHEVPTSMSAWQVTSYQDGGRVELSNDVEVPIIDDPSQVLVKVTAASVNPLDVEMMRGFGSVLLKNLRQLDSLCQKRDNASELPLVLGRDFAGVVVAKGSSVSDFQIGDEVYGVVKPQDRGSHAEYAVTTNTLLARKPTFVSMEAASAILYTSLTAWSALKITGGLIIASPVNKRVLVLGSSGGVGQAAIQLLHAWGAQVIASCRTDAVPVVEKLSPEAIIDYTSPNYMSEIKAAGTYDIILDAAGLTETELQKYADYVNSCGSIVALRSPLLENIDNYGILYGSVKSAVELALPNLTSGILKKGGLIKWAFFLPCSTAVKEVSDLVNQNKLIPEIEKVYPFTGAMEAYSRMKAGHLRGKIVISMDEDRKQPEGEDKKESGGETKE